jgi:hypothetical protein
VNIYLKVNCQGLLNFSLFVIFIISWWVSYYVLSTVIGNMYSETCEIRTSLGRDQNVPNSNVSSFQSAICTENSSLGPDGVSLFHRMSSCHRVDIHRFCCQCMHTWNSSWQQHLQWQGPPLTVHTSSPAVIILYSGTQHVHLSEWTPQKFEDNGRKKCSC